MPVDQVERAYRAWPVLIGRAEKCQTITYGELGAELGVHHRAVRFLLAVIQDYCLESKLPPLTILIVNTTGLPGNGFIAHDLDHFEEGLDQVYSYDWSALDNPFEITRTKLSYQSLVDELSTEPESSEEIYSRIKSRGVRQMAFRDSLLQAYSRRCCFTGVRAVEALEACHIVPWSLASNSERLDVRNGILLNSFHHRLFDAGHITITASHRIAYIDFKEAKHSYSGLERSLTSGLHGEKMRLPKSLHLHPQSGYIQRHNELIGWDADALEFGR